MVAVEGVVDEIHKRLKDLVDLDELLTKLFLLGLFERIFVLKDRDFEHLPF